MKYANKEDLKELQELAEPLFKLLKEKHCPHTAIVINHDNARIVEDWCGVRNPYKE